MKYTTLKLLVAGLSVFALITCAANSTVSTSWIMLFAFSLFAMPIAVGQAVVLVFAAIHTPNALLYLVGLFAAIDFVTFSAFMAAEKQANKIKFARVQGLKVPANNIPRGM